MDEFLTNFQSVVQWIVGILGDLLDLAMEYPFMAVIIVAGIGFLVYDNILLILSGHKGSKVKTSPVKVSKLSGAGTFGVGGVGIFGLGKKNGASSVSVSMAAKSGTAPAGYSSVVGGSKFTKGKLVAAKDNGHYSGRGLVGTSKDVRDKYRDLKTKCQINEMVSDTFASVDSGAEDYGIEERSRSRSGFYRPDPPPSNYNIDIFVD